MLQMFVALLLSDIHLLDNCLSFFWKNCHFNLVAFFHVELLAVLCFGCPSFQPSNCDECWIRWKNNSLGCELLVLSDLLTFLKVPNYLFIYYFLQVLMFTEFIGNYNFQIWEGIPIRIYEIGRFKLVDGKFSP